MNAVDRSKAGVASGILSMTRMVGSTFGVAALGAVIATVGRSQLATRLPHVGIAERGRLVDLLGSGASTTHLPGAIQSSLNETYVYALTKGLYAIGSFALIGALLAWVLVKRPAAPPAREPALAPPAKVLEPGGTNGSEPAVLTGSEAPALSGSGPAS
jgi:hypothetical protein